MADAVDASDAVFRRTVSSTGRHIGLRHLQHDGRRLADIVLIVTTSSLSHCRSRLHDDNL